MLPGREQFHQSVFAVFLIQRKCSPYQYRSRDNTEPDANPLVDTHHIQDDEHYKYREQSGSEQEQILRFQSFKFSTFPNPLV